MTHMERGDGVTREELVQRVALMEEMIAEGRQSTARYGWMFVLWGLTYFAAIAWTVYLPYTEWAWPVCIAACSVVVRRGAVAATARWRKDRQSAQAQPGCGVAGDRRGNHFVSDRRDCERARQGAGLSCRGAVLQRTGEWSERADSALVAARSGCGDLVGMRHGNAVLHHADGGACAVCDGDVLRDDSVRAICDVAGAA